MTRRLLPYGDRAVLVEVGALDEVLDLHAALKASAPPGIIDIVPAARTVAVTLDPATLPIERARTWLAGVDAPPAPPPDGEPVTIDVHYTGRDLPEVARLLGLSVDAVIELHTASLWRVAFSGFAPGFGYLVTDHDRLVVPRRSTPRTRVPAGSVGLAGEFSGVYPRSSPGGWQLIGVSDAVLWDSAVAEPALLAPGRAVRFRSA